MTEPTTRGKRLAANRSPRWAFMQKFEVPDYDHPERNYLTRWRIVQTPWFGLYLHRMDGPDPRPTLHDHPWSFLSVVLRGGYYEHRLDPMTLKVERRWVTRFNRMRPSDAHFIKALRRVPTWTFVVVGRRVRTWGYFEDTDIAGRWEWTEFDQHPYNDEFELALSARKQR